MSNHSTLLDALPKDWKAKKIKFVFDERKEFNDPVQTEILVSLTHDRGVILHSEKGDIGNKEKDDLTKYKIVHPGDIVVNSMNVIIGSSGLSKYYGLVSPVYYMLRKKNEDDNNKFFHYLFRSLIFQKSLVGVGNGILEHRMRVPMDKLGSHLIPLPPPQEQKFISSYLDKKTSQLDTLINKVEKKIELLKEQRTSLINQCVTKGLDQNVEMKESGVEWIGEIPKHWETTKLKLHGEVLIGLSFDKDDIVDDGNGTLVLRSSNVQNGKVSFTDNIWVKTEVPDKLFVRNGDILICSRNGSRDLIGKNCILREESTGMTWGVFMSVFRTDTPNFFYWVLNSQVFKSQSGLYLTSTINQLTVTTLENLTFPYVSDINEQQAIHEFLSKRVGSINEIIQCEERRINTLKEYRQSLISSVVTGMLRVTEDMV